MKYFLFVSLAVIFIGVSPAYGKGKLNVAEVVNRTAALVEQQFVDQEVAQKSAIQLRAWLKQGRYQQFKQAERLALKLTQDLKQLTQDNHIGLVFDPGSVGRYRTRELAKTDAAAREQAQVQRQERIIQAANDNFGLRAVEMLGANIGYLRLDYFDGFVEESATVFNHALALLAPADAIILDLRFNGGGNSKALPRFLGYFLGPEAVHFATKQERWKNLKQEIFTEPDDQSVRFYDKPIYILTSGTTFSLAEHVSYHLRAFERAVLVGERTYGGGMAFDPVVINDQLYLRLPRVHMINARTHMLYREGEGLSPDVAIDAAYAKDKAYWLALEEIKNAENENEVHWLQRVVSARLNRAGSHEDSVKACGSFGEFSFERRGKDLWLSFRQLPWVKLVDLGNGYYLDDRSISRQFHFFQKPSGNLGLTLFNYGDAKGKRIVSDGQQADSCHLVSTRK